MKRFLLTIAALVVLRAAASTQTAPSSDYTLAQKIAREIAQVKGGTTPSEWLHAHPDEKLQMFNGRQLANDTHTWCARTVVAHAATMGRAWTRSVYFYDPQPPADDALPAPGASQREALETTCRLGLMWVDIRESNQAVGTKVAEDIEAALVPLASRGSILLQWVFRKEMS
jgi:hypothetical protein